MRPTAPQKILGHMRGEIALWQSPESTIYLDSLSPERALQWQFLPEESYPALKNSTGLTPELVPILNCEQQGQEMFWAFDLPPGKSVAESLPMPTLELHALITLTIRLLTKLSDRGWICTRLSPETLYFEPETEQLTLVDPGALLSSLEYGSFRMSGSQFPPEVQLNRRAPTPEALQAFVLGSLILRLLGQPELTAAELMLNSSPDALKSLSPEWQRRLKTLLSPLPEARPQSLRQWWQESAKEIHITEAYSLRMQGQSDRVNFCVLPFWHPEAGSLTLLALLQSSNDLTQNQLHQLALQNLTGRLFNNLLEHTTLPQDSISWQKICQQILLQTQQDLIKWCDQNEAELSVCGSLALLGPEAVYLLHLGGEAITIFNSEQPLEKYKGGEALQRKMPQPFFQKVALQVGSRLLLSNQAIIPLRERLVTPYLCAQGQMILEATYFGAPA